MSCPVPFDLLSLLLRCDDARLDMLVGGLPEAQRAALALYCFDRYHMRRLGFAIALRCPEDALESVGGTNGRQMLELARNTTGSSQVAAASAKRKIVLTRAAA